MKKTVLSFFLLTLTFVGYSYNWQDIQSLTPSPVKIQLVSSTIEQTKIHVSVPGFFLQEVRTAKGNAFVVQVDETTPLLASGAPDLPKVTSSVVIPDQAGMSVRVISSSFKDFTNLDIAPSKGVISRDVDPATIPFQYGQAYQTNAFFPGELTGLREPFIVRELRGQTVILYPFQYNPVTKTLRVYYDIEIELVKSAELGANPLSRKAGETRLDQNFASAYSNQFLNFDAVTYAPLEEYGKMLVISYGQFMNDMEPYVRWKNQIGIPTEMVDVATVGATASAIKAYIADYYNTNGLTFVLLVGDAAQIPTNTGGGLGGPSDNAYGYIVGSDHYIDVFIGRFSAENVTHVQTQVQRTLNYEMNPDSITSDWYTSVIGIASNQGPGDDGEMDYEHIRNQQDQLLAYTYTWNFELFDGSQGGNDAGGNPTPSQVAAAVNDGSSLIIYCGHGSMTSWGTSGFSNNNVNNLTNQGKLPFIWSVACVNGQFNAGTCFAEAWLRASKTGEPTGAIAFLGSTINQSWNSPMEGQDEMTDILAEAYPDNIKRSFAGLSLNGCMKMIDSYGYDGSNMADTWTVFGDPTVVVRTDNPETMVAVHDSLLLMGDSLLLVTCNVPGARVTATINNSIIATTLIQNDTALLLFPSLQNPGDTIRLVVSAYNHIPVIADIPVLMPSMPELFDFTANYTEVIPGSTVIFTDSIAGTITNWYWSFPGGTPSVSTEHNPVVTYDSIGVFDVQLIVSNMLGGDSLLKTSYITVDWPASVRNDEKSTIQVTPNPNNGSFTVNLNSWNSPTVNLSITNMIGKEVYRRNFLVVKDNQTFKADLTNQPNGIYFLSVEGESSTSVTKIVLKR